MVGKGKIRCPRSWRRWASPGAPRFESSRAWRLALSYSHRATNKGGPVLKGTKRFHRGRTPRGWQRLERGASPVLRPRARARQRSRRLLLATGRPLPDTNWGYRCSPDPRTAAASAGLESRAHRLAGHRPGHGLDRTAATRRDEMSTSTAHAAGGRRAPASGKKTPEVRLAHGIGRRPGPRAEVDNVGRSPDGVFFAREARRRPHSPAGSRRYRRRRDNRCMPAP